jgi:hypothetical protein
VTLSEHLVTIANVELNSGPFTCLNSHVLTDPAPKRRQNIEQAAVGGVHGTQSFKTSRTVDLEILVRGETSPAGAPYSDTFEGVERNINYLRANVYEATEDANGCVEAEVTSSYGGSYTGDVQIDDMLAQPGIGMRIVVLEVTIPDGYLPLVGGS